MSIATPEKNAPRVLARPEHRLSRSLVSSAAIKVLYRLQRSGYLAYIVGGGVRDILLGRRPRDFDVATNARPHEIRRLFRNSRIIGRRFRLVHVFFKNEIIEVSTFRASPEAPEGPDDWEEAQAEEREISASDTPVDNIVDFNLYGTPVEDAIRRDLTVNALFYNIADFSIIDYVGGLEDLDAGIIRTIGEPTRRFEEDPVRMMRALEYSVRLGFEIEETTSRAIREKADLVSGAASARLTYELLEGLRSGRAAGIWRAWSEFGLADRAFPNLAPRDDSIDPLLAVVDGWVKAGQRLDDAELLGVFFLSRYVEILNCVTGENGRIDNAGLINGLREMLEPVSAGMHLSNFAVHRIHHGLFACSKMKRRPERGRQVLKLVRQEYFGTAWRLYTVGVKVGLLDGAAYDAWARAVDQVGRAPDREPELVVDTVKRTRRRRSRRRRRS